jgi:hypothetical protein
MERAQELANSKDFSHLQGKKLLPQFTLASLQNELDAKRRILGP